MWAGEDDRPYGPSGEYRSTHLRGVRSDFLGVIVLPGIRDGRCFAISHTPFGNWDYQTIDSYGQPCNDFSTYSQPRGEGKSPRVRSLFWAGELLELPHPSQPKGRRNAGAQLARGEV